MTIVLSRQSIELAQCANLEILAVMPVIFDCFESVEAGKSLVRALEMYQEGLEALTPELDADTLAEMITAHAEIKRSFLEAADVARFPSELIHQVAAAFDDFATGLRGLQNRAKTLPVPSIH